MSKKKKRMGLVLVLIMIVTAALSGCNSSAGNPTATPNPTSGANQSSVTPTPTPTAAAAESNYPSYLNLDGYRPIVKDEKITLTVMTRRDTIATSDISTNHSVKFIEDVLNIKLDVEEIYSNNATERKNLMLASNDLKDIMINCGFSTADMVTYGMENQMLLAMSDYFSETLTPALLKSMEGQDFAIAGETLPDGKMYTVPRWTPNYDGFGDTIMRTRVFINTNWLNGIGRTTAPETLDDFVNMLREFKEKDPMGVGSNKIIPMLSSFGQDRVYIQNAFGWIGAGAEGYSVCYDVNKKEVVIPCGEETFADYIRLLNQLYSEGLIHEDFFTIDRTGARALYVEGVVPVVADTAPYVSMPDSYKDYISAIPLSSQYSKIAGAQRSDAFTRGNMVISAATKYPEVCMRLLDYMYTEEGSLYSYYGPTEGSDTLGIVSGYKLNSSGTNIEMADVANKKRESDYDYRVNSIIIAQNAPADMRRTDLYKLELLGVTNPAFPSLNLDDGDDHYRYLVFQASQGYMYDALPTAYLRSEIVAEVTDLKTVIEDFVKYEVSRFVVGQRPLTEIDKFYAELKSLGYDRYKEINVELYADYIASIK